MEDQGLAERRSHMVGAASLKMAGRALKAFLIILSAVLMVAAAEATIQVIVMFFVAGWKIVWATLACLVAAMVLETNTTMFLMKGVMKLAGLLVLPPPRIP